MAFEAFYLPAALGRRFCLLHSPRDRASVRGAVVYVHPFAEEMNKSRRMAALQAKALAVAGYWVLQIDLLGCGDSSGDFGDATWQAWIDDVTLAYAWLQERSGMVPWLWGLRGGALLVGEAARLMSQAPPLLFWQPVVSGRQLLQQFLRLKIAGELLGGDGKGRMERLREQLKREKSVEVAGYRLSLALASGLEKADLSVSAQPARVEWIELSAREAAPLSPFANATLAKWQAAGYLARGRVVCGPAFWQTAEIAESPALLTASLEALSELASA